MRGVVARVWQAGHFHRGWIAWEQGRIRAAGTGEPPRSVRADLEDLGRTRVLPGFVDTLLHGYAGVDCADGTAGELQRMTRALAAAGVTTVFAGMYPAPLEDLAAAARRWDRWRAARGGVRARVAGWHLEGPFLDPDYRGALPRRGILAANAGNAERLLRACGPWLRIATLAPERPGALDAAEVLRSAGVLPSVGHSRAGYLDCEMLAANGPVGMTHLGNRMLPWSAREPGPIGFAVEGRADWVGVIPDMVHVAPESLRAWAGVPALCERLMACSDNLSHAGLPAEDFRAGGQRLRRSGAVAVDAGGGLGGTLDALPELLMRCVRDGCLSMAQAVRMGCEIPGRLAGDCGRLEEGCRADLVALDEEDAVARVWIGGRLAGRS